MVSRPFGWLAIVAVAASCTPRGPAGEASLADSGLAPAVVPAVVLDALDQGGEATVLVRLDDRVVPALYGSDRTPMERRERLLERTAAIGRLSDDFVNRLPPDVTLDRTYDHIPVVALRLSSPDAARALASQVVSIQPDGEYDSSLAQSLPLIGQPAAALDGHIGDGVAIAVFDTGADWSKADLGSCTAVGTPSSCRVVYADDIAPSDGKRDTSGHGTNVASIAARVAPGADIISLDVFSANGHAFTSDLLSAFDWVITNQETYNIAVVNLSLGGGGYDVPCGDTDPLTSAVQSARAAGVSVVAASGNDAYTDSLASPACIDEVVSVGAVYDASFGAFGWSACVDGSTAADQVTCFSNAADFLDLLAPGAVVTAGGYSMGGTSMAAPHVSGALAVLRADDPDATVDDLEGWLVETGAPITDARTGTSFPRLDLAAAVAPCVAGLSSTAIAVPGAGGSGTIDVTAPDLCRWSASSDQGWFTLDTTRAKGNATLHWTATGNSAAQRTANLTVDDLQAVATQAPGPGTVSINNGAVATNTGAVTLTLWSSNASQMCISNTTTCTAFRSYATSLPWTLATGTGVKTVYVTYKDGSGTTSPAATDTIIVDTTKPTNGTVTANGLIGGVTLAFSGFSDASGLSGYRVQQATGTTAPATCTTTPTWSGPDTSATLTGLTTGTNYSFRVCAVDIAGNVSTGTALTFAPRAEYDAPVGTVTINAGAPWTKSTAATLTLAATDASGVSNVCISNTSTCTAFVAMASSLPWTLPTGDGTKTIFATFKDSLGNVSTAVTDTIGFDTALPINGTVSATSGVSAVDLAFTGFSDAASGVASYKVVSAAGATAPANCTGTASWTGTTSSAHVTGLTNGTSYAFRACAIDGAGNMSAGVTTTGIPRAEITPPTGSIVLAGGADFVGSASMTVALTATDDTGVTEACLSNTTTCTTWFSMTSSTSWSATTGAGLKTVTAWFRDAAGNVSAPVTDTTTVDTTKPVNGTVTGVPGNGSATLSWTGFTDPAGIGSYTVVYGTILPATCATGTVGYTGSDTTATVTGLTNLTTYQFRVCATDTAGNLSTGSTTSVKPLSETNPPTGTVVIDGGAAWTNNKTLALAFDAIDDSGVASTCVSSSTTCTSYSTYATTGSFTATTTTGEKTVYAYFKDTQGNISAAATDTIGYDPTLPVNGTATATPADGAVALAWSGFSDADSGLASYKVVYAPTTAPATCATGTVGYTGTALAASVSGLTNGTTYGFRVCAIDNAGNVSAGAAVTSNAAPEAVPPTGSVLANNDDVYSKSKTINVAITASDASGMGQMCVATTSTCTTWKAFAASTTTAVTTDGLKTVNVWLTDLYGNQMGPVSDTITVDSALPINGTVTATAGTASANLSWTGFSDATSGIASYTAVYQTGTSAPASCNAGTVGYTGATPSATLSGLVSGTTYRVRVCATDAAGNLSVGATTSVTAL